jgi:hypothetical protein
MVINNRKTLLKSATFEITNVFFIGECANDWDKGGDNFRCWCDAGWVGEHCDQEAPVYVNVKGVEVTQGVQNFINSMPIVADRTVRYPCVLYDCMFYLFFHNTPIIIHIYVDIHSCGNWRISENAASKHSSFARRRSCKSFDCVARKKKGFQFD